MKLGRDRNGNKLLKVDCGSRRGFSVQTLGNLPKTHTMTKCDFDEHTATAELYDHIHAHGTQRQKELLDLE